MMNDEVTVNQFGEIQRLINFPALNQSFSRNDRSATPLTPKYLSTRGKNKTARLAINYTRKVLVGIPFRAKNPSANPISQNVGFRLLRDDSEKIISLILFISFSAPAEITILQSCSFCFSSNLKR